MSACISKMNAGMWCKIASGTWISPLLQSTENNFWYQTLCSPDNETLALVHTCITMTGIRKGWDEHVVDFNITNSLEDELMS